MQMLRPRHNPEGCDRTSAGKKLRIVDWGLDDQIVQEWSVDKKELQDRTKRFALRIIKLVESLPPRRATDQIGRQLLRAGTSVAANYRAACRAKSNADFVSKMGIVEEEAYESLFWMEILIEAGIVEPSKLKSLMAEANELVSIVVASIQTARRRRR